MYWTSHICKTVPSWDLDSLKPFMYQTSSREDLTLYVEKEKPHEIQASSDTQMCVEPKHNENTSSQEAYVKKEDKSKKNETELLFVKKCQDPLFWSLYLAQYGYGEYERVGKHNGNIEMDEKKKIANHFFSVGSKQLSELTQTKITKAGCGRIVEEILTLPKTALSCLPAYCVYYKCNIYLVDLKKNIYLRYTCSDSEQTIVLYKNDAQKWPQYYIDTEQKKYTLEYLSLHFICLVNHEKPLKSMSSYKTIELEAMASVLNINCETKMKKAELYEKIILHCVPEF